MRKSLKVVAISAALALAVAMPVTSRADEQPANPCAAKQAAPGNPCAAKKMKREKAKKKAAQPANPCAAKQAAPGNPCAAKNPCSAPK